MTAEALDRALDTLEQALQTSPAQLDGALHQLRLVLQSLRATPGLLATAQLTAARHRLHRLGELARLRQQRCARLAAALEPAPLTYARPVAPGRRPS